LLYTTGALIGPPTADAMDLTMNGTTVGMILTSNMTEIGTKFTLIYNDTDNVNPFLQRHFLIDKIVVFEDNKLNTQSSSYEFMLSGSII